MMTAFSATCESCKRKFDYGDYNDVAAWMNKHICQCDSVVDIGGTFFRCMDGSQHFNHHFKFTATSPVKVDRVVTIFWTDGV